MSTKNDTIFDLKLVKIIYKISKSDIFWIDINNLSIEQLFNRMEFSLDYELTPRNIIEFSSILARIVDYRSHYTVAHAYTVSTLAELIGDFFDLNQDQRKKLLIAGFLHDIGKIGVDPTLIEKPGKLTNDEYSQVKLNSYFTGKILKDL